VIHGSSMSTEWCRMYCFCAVWEQQFCFTDIKGKSVPLLCKASVAVPEKSKVS
jgi:hypothetical protein